MEGRELWGEGQWALLRKLVEERKPMTIAIDSTDIVVETDEGPLRLSVAAPSR